MPIDIQRDSIVARSLVPVAADVAGETVLMSLERSKCYGLGVTGTEIWKQIATPIRISDLAVLLAADYDADQAVIEKDLLELFSNLQSEGLVEVSTSVA